MILGAVGLGGVYCDRVLFQVFGVWDQRNSPLPRLLVPPPFEDGAARNCNCRVPCVVDVYLIFVENRKVVRLRKFVYAHEVVSYAPYHVYFLCWFADVERELFQVVGRSDVPPRVLKPLVGFAASWDERVAA